VSKANAILAGNNPDDVLGGNKVRSFFDNIIRPKTSEAVPLTDTPMTSLCSWSWTLARRPLLERKGGYEAIADLYRSAGRELGIRPLQAQAIAWVVWRAQV